jgi:hypothetical protein
MRGLRLRRSGSVVTAAIVALLPTSGCVRQETAPSVRQGTAPALSSSAPNPPIAAARAPTKSTPPKVASASEVHDEVASLVLAGLRDHDFDAVERQFDAAMREEVPKEKIGRVWSTTVATQGELISWTLIKRASQDGFDQLRFALKHEHGEFEALVIFPREGHQVAGLLIRPKGALP